MNDDRMGDRSFPGDIALNTSSLSTVDVCVMKLPALVCTIVKL